MRNNNLINGLAVFIACILTALSSILPASAPSDSLDIEVRDFRLTELEAALQKTDPGPEHDYFAGILANRKGQIEPSIRLLTGAVAGIRETQPSRTSTALEALADDYMKTFRYADAAKTYDDLLTHFPGTLTGNALQGVKDDSGVAHVLQGSPAQTITRNGPVYLKTERNIIGSVVTELKVNGVSEKWLLDTGANMSVVSKTFAQKLGLNPLPGRAQTQSGVTGIENPMQLALLPILDLGGARLNNVVVLILDDANLNISLGRRSYQINAILGYPVFQALGSITFLHNGGFEASTDLAGAQGARMYMNLLTPIIECSVEGQALPFSFDTGASGTDLSVRYFQLFQSEAAGWKKTEGNTAGAGGAVRRKIFIQSELNLAVGDKTVTLKRVGIFPEKMNSDIDALYGNLGQDLVSGFQSFTLDFVNMRFSLGAPLK